MPTRFILVKFCRATLIQKVWVCGLVVRGADLWGMYVYIFDKEHFICYLACIWNSDMEFGLKTTVQPQVEFLEKGFRHF